MSSKTKTSWYSISNQDSGIPEILIYGDIGGIFDEDVGSKQFREDLARIEKTNTTGTINLRVNSRGGSYFEATSIFNAIQDTASKVVAYVEGVAASAASYIIMAANEIVMDPGTMIIIHDPFPANAGWDSIDSMKRAVETLVKIKERILDAYASKSGIGRDTLSGMMTDQTAISATEAFDMGFADTVTANGNDKDNPQVKDFNNWLSSEISSINLLYSNNEVNDMDKPAKADVNIETETTKGSAPLAPVMRTESEITARILDASVSAAKAERDRIKAIDRIAIPGYEELVNSAKFGGENGVDDLMEAGDVALKILSIEKAKGSEYLNSLKAQSEAVSNISDKVDKKTSGDPMLDMWNSSQDLRDQFAEYNDFKSLYEAEGFSG